MKRVAVVYQTKKKPGTPKGVPGFFRPLFKT
jgi:hypothetical protein